MISRTWALAIVGVVLVAALALSHWAAYQSGRTSEAAAHARETQKHVARIETLERAARAASRNTGHSIEVQRRERSAEADRARSVIGPVRMCDDTRRAEVRRAAGAAAAAVGTEAEAALPVRAGEDSRAAGDLPRDIGPELVALIAACQRDHDDEQAWREWWAAQRALGAGPH